ncbi:MAG TPA: SUMF1/EgtB/PvdO family nonheme iron enzyme [Streptosporangiaceae bacterium]
MQTETHQRQRERRTPTAGMTWIPSGEFAMGSADFYPEERPVHAVAVDGFWIDTRQVTVAEYRRFVKQTGHITVAEQAPDPAAYPDAQPDLLVPGSLVFRKAASPVDLRDYATWWAYVPFFRARHQAGERDKACCAPRNPRVSADQASRVQAGDIPRRVIKGGSHLCAPNCCLRYRPAARQGEAVDTSTGHLGFRCVLRPAD